MSRRAPDPAAQRAAQNQATIKSLLKLEPNKICADCKRNKHPRWASWNLGVFVCIRCSGIHRGMGTHISRVKSVDLDSWTDEQLQSVLSWGNARANKYWEAKLAAGHVPSESKIENFIRTKYELKRWAMDGPRPDPSTLDVDGDDDVPLSIVKEKQTIDRNETIRKTSVGQQSAPRQPVAAPQPDLIGGVDTGPPRASTTGPPPTSKPPPKAQPAPPKATSTKESLLGLDFLGGTTAPPRPASTTGVSTPGAQSRPDLKQSILSLYASAPRQPPPQQQPHHQQQGSFSGMGSPTMGHHPQPSGGFTDAFSSLSLQNTTSPKPAAADPFASFGSISTSTARPAQPPSSNNSFDGLSGGGFFNQKPAQPAPPAHQKQPSTGGFGGFGDFGDFSSPAPAAPSQPKPAQPSSSAMGDLFDLSAPATTSPPLKSPAASITSPQATSSSVFNLSAPQASSTPLQQSKPTGAALSAFGGGGLSGADVWGSNEWAAPASTPTPAAAAPAPALRSPPAPAISSNDFGGWGDSSGFGAPPAAPAPAPAGPPKVSADEEFGGWTSSTGQKSSTTNKPSGGGFGADEDLFSNVWQ